MKKVVEYFQRHKKDSIFVAIVIANLAGVFFSIYFGEFYLRSIALNIGMFACYFAFRLLVPIKTNEK